MREIDRFVTMLFPKDGSQLVDIKFFPGERSVTVEEFCGEVHSAFLQIESGLSEFAQNFEETGKQVSVDRFLVGG